MSEHIGKHIGYKKAQDGFIVKLLIGGENNENREDVVSKDTAKMRCSEAKVLEIYHMNNRHITLPKVYSLYSRKFVYKVGKKIVIQNYDRNTDAICTTGIHYFLTEDPARCWNLQCHHIPNYTGTHMMWFGNGQLSLKERYVDGVRIEYEWYYNNGQLKECGSLINGRREWMYYQQNGILKELRVYQNRRLKVKGTLFGGKWFEWKYRYVNRKKPKNK